MGTSASHSGPKSGVSFDPPWLDDIEGMEKPEDPEKDTKGALVEPRIAPSARFMGARLNLNDYIKSGNRDSLRKSLGHYSRTGMGGAQNIANRMRYSANVASKLYSTFSTLQEGNESTINKIINNYQEDNIDIYGMIDAIASYICGDGASLDETSPINSVSEALSDLLEKNPEIDLFALSDDNIWSLVSSFLSYEAFSRIQLDIGRGFEAINMPLHARIARLNDMREYLESEISSQINIIRGELGNKQLSNLHDVMLDAIERTFKVFEVAK